jgi:hypothetical protein
MFQGIFHGFNNNVMGDLQKTAIIIYVCQCVLEFTGRIGFHENRKWDKERKGNKEGNQLI